MILIFLKNLQNQKNQSKKTLTLKNTIILLNGGQKILDALESGIFPKGKQDKSVKSILDRVACLAKVSNHKQLKTNLTPKQMLQRLSIALAQVKAGNTSENLLHEICLFIYSLYQANRIIKKVHNNIMNSINL